MNYGTECGGTGRRRGVESIETLLWPNNSAISPQKAHTFPVF